MTRTWQASIRLSILVVLLQGVAGAGFDPPTDDAAQRELKQFQGTWQALSIQNADGIQAPAAQVADTHLVVQGNTFTLTSKDAVIQGTFTVEPTRTPKTIDATLPTQMGRDVKLLGIYEVKGDIRRSCFAMPDKDRPTSFVPAAGCIGFEWKRK